MVLGKLPVPGRPTFWIVVGQGSIAHTVGAGGGCLDIFTLLYPFYSLCPSVWETAQYRLKYCPKGPLNPKQLTNNKQTTLGFFVIYSTFSNILISYRKVVKKTFKEQLRL